MLLKRKLSPMIGMTLGGVVVAAIGFGGWFLVGGYAGLIPGVFGVIGLLWVCIGGLTLLTRGRLVIAIDDSGIELPVFRNGRVGGGRLLIRREEIVSISKHESIRGRIIEIVTKDRRKLPVPARFYCELDEFLAHCTRHGLPVA